MDVPKFDIVPILEAHGLEHVPVHHGRRLKVRCPYHGDSNPSASVDTVKQHFRCYACGVHGDAIDLVQKEEGLDFQAAIQRCEELTGQEGGALSRAVVQPRRLRPARLSDQPGADRGDHPAVPAGRRRRAPRRL